MPNDFSANCPKIFVEYLTYTPTIAKLMLEICVHSEEEWL